MSLFLGESKLLTRNLLTSSTILLMEKFRRGGRGIEATEQLTYQYQNGVVGR